MAVGPGSRAELYRSTEASCVLLERINSIREFHPELWRVHVDAGVTTANVHRIARENGLYFPPDPGAAEQSQIGGNLACNAAGPHSFKYGSVSGWVTGVEAVIRDGVLVRFGGPVRKDVAGYDMRSLLVGSEGSLGVITGAWLRLIPAPEAALSVVAGYPDLQTGATALRRVFGYGLSPATLEFFDSDCVRVTRASFPGGLPSSIGFLIISEADGSLAEARRLRSDIASALGEGSIYMPGEGDTPSQGDLQRWRSGVSFAVSAQRGGKMSEDIAVPIESFEDAVALVAELGNRYGLPSCSWGHAGDGNLHATFMLDAKATIERHKAEEAANALFEATLRLGGTVSGEHGLGWVKRNQFRRQFNQYAADLQWAVKMAFDPANLFNPGKKLAL